MVQHHPNDQMIIIPNNLLRLDFDVDKVKEVTVCSNLI